MLESDQAVSRIILTDGMPALPTLEMQIVAPPSEPLDETIIDVLDDSSTWQPGEALPF